MKKIIILGIIAIILIPIISINLVSAHCPLCTGAAVAGVGIARTYGVDDSIVGVLLGGFIASTGLWVHNWLKKRKRKIDFPLQALVLVVVSFLMLAIPMYMKEMIIDFEMVMSMPEMHSILGMGVYGIDKLLLGMIAGALLISGVFTFSDYLKKRNNGKRLFMYQGFVFMIISLVILSGIFWLLTK